MATYCTACGKECFDEAYPEVVFSDRENVICEECSIDYEVNNKGTVVKRTEL